MFKQKQFDTSYDQSYSKNDSFEHFNNSHLARFLDKALLLLNYYSTYSQKLLVLRIKYQTFIL